MRYSLVHAKTFFSTSGSSEKRSPCRVVACSLRAHGGMNRPSDVSRTSEPTAKSDPLLTSERSIVSIDVGGIVSSESTKQIIWPRACRAPVLRAAPRPALAWRTIRTRLSWSANRRATSIERSGEPSSTTTTSRRRCVWERIDSRHSARYSSTLYTGTTTDTSMDRPAARCSLTASRSRVGTIRVARRAALLMISCTVSRPRCPRRAVAHRSSRPLAARARTGGQATGAPPRVTTGRRGGRSAGDGLRPGRRAARAPRRGPPRPPRRPARTEPSTTPA